MYAKELIQVDADPSIVLKCAYDTLISMRSPKKHNLNELTHIDENLLFANVSGRFNTIGIFTYPYVCLLTVVKVNEASCQLTISIGVKFNNATETGDYIELISEFFKLFSQNLQQILPNYHT